MLADKKTATSRLPKPKHPAAGQRTITELFLPNPKITTIIDEKATTEKATGDPVTGSEAILEPVIIADTSTPTPITLSLKTGQTDRKDPPKKLFPIFNRKPLARTPSMCDDSDAITDFPDTAAIAPADLLSKESSHSADLSLAGPEPIPLAHASAPAKTGGSRDNPIVLDSTPVKSGLETERNPPSRLIAPLAFAVRERKQKLPSNTNRISRNIDIPYPTSESQHIRGHQSVFSSPAPLYPSRTNAIRRTSEASIDNLFNLKYNSINISETSPISGVAPSSNLADADKRNDIDNNLQDFPNHPAISRFLEQTPQPTAASLPSQKTWADKWRPTRAEHVLGNEWNATYLRDWLRALALRTEDNVLPLQNGKAAPRGHATAKSRVNRKGNKRPRIIRSVQKGKGRKKPRRDSDEDDWIVDDDVFSHMYSSSEDEETLSQNLDGPEHPTCPTTAILDTEHLMNTILLAGPPGCGKTAAVYACAEEMDWEIFEVYPGIGKRNSASLDHLIGDVGKNHLVRKSQGSRAPQISCQPPLVGLLPAGMREVSLADCETVRDKGSPPPETEPITNCKPSMQETDTPSSRPEKIRQSLVLLEEVDILFKDDIGFWPAVINIIKDCKRPVIMTCSDITLIPKDDLPLQTVLTFDPCPTPLALSYLQSMCMAEGYLVRREELGDLYRSSNEFGLVDAPAGYLKMTSPKPDLRWAINHLQFWCSCSEKSNKEVFKANGECDRKHDIMIDWSGWEAWKESKQLRQLALMHSELASFVDGEMFSYLSSTEEIPSADDEIGHTILFGACAEPPHMAGMNIGDGIMQSSRGAVEKLACNEPASSLLGYRSQMVDALNTLIGPSAPRCAAILDYEPWIRHMVRVDDVYERNCEGRMRRLRRVTRSSQGTYERYLSLSTAKLELIRATRFEE